jgi:hypothetical protein
MLPRVIPPLRASLYGNVVNFFQDSMGELLPCYWNHVRASVAYQPRCVVSDLNGTLGQAASESHPLPAKSGSSYF